MGQLTRFWKLPKEYENIFFLFEDKFENYLYENYSKSRFSGTLGWFYLLKPAIPRAIQIYARRYYSKIISDLNPDWIINDELEKLRREALTQLNYVSKIPCIWFWPNNKEFAFVITHDVETDKGLKNIEKIIKTETKYGLRSSFYFVAEDYDVPESLINDLKKEGFEIGIHGLNHDGKLFSSYETFIHSSEKMKKYIYAWHVCGFRSPSLLRCAEWMKGLPFEYDSSFPDYDPFGPQPGGCLSIFPYFLGNLVELPITLAQDHTIFEILRLKDIAVWKKKIDWIKKMNGMILIIIHPDYINEVRLKLYEELLIYILEKKDGWFALARDINEWWRNRDASHIAISDNNTFYIEGPAAPQGNLRMLGEVIGGNRTPIP
ncbi:MAG: polysaccharide deacetylase family protein [bacterium]